MLKYYKDLKPATKSTTTNKPPTTDSTDNKQNDDDNNTKPTDDTPATSQILSAFKWGLVPSFSKDGKTHFRTINARQDTIKSKPMYRRLVNKKRCVVLFSGFYEWQNHKQPYYFTPEYAQNHNKSVNNEPLMFMAAVWDIWRDPKDSEHPLFTVSIITTDSNKDVSFCHHRMPLLMTRECVDKWLNVGQYSIDQCFKVIAESQKFITIKNVAVCREIVGDTRIKGIECIQPLEQKRKQTGLHRFFKTEKAGKKKSEKKEKMNVDEDLKRVIEESKVSYKKEQEKRGKKRRFDEVDELEDLDELKISKKQKLNTGAARKRKWINSKTKTPQNGNYENDKFMNDYQFFFIYNLFNI